MSEGKVVSYLGRLTGARIDSASAIKLSSAQKATFASWLRREEIHFEPTVLQRGTFSLAVLLGSRVALTEAAPRPHFEVPLRGKHSDFRIGIDLEHIDTLPDASDYREHEFYRDNFTPAEIAHCLQRPDAKASLCGLWAAKEAVLKATGVVRPGTGMLAIEISHDENGRPKCDGGELSISHSNGFCVAVFAVSET